MGLDQGTFPDVLIQEMMFGLLTTEVSQADSICTPGPFRTTMSGSVPVLKSISTLARDEEIGLAPLAIAQELGGEMTSAPYTALARVGRSFVSDEERNDMGAYGQDAVALHLRLVRMQANFKTDRALATALASTVLNNTFNCNSDGAGEWNDYTNGTPLQDLLLAADSFAPDADTLVLGRSVYDALVAHPDIKAQLVNINAGQIDYSGLAAILRVKVPNLQQIFVLDKLYNSGAKGQALSTARLFRNNAWLGHKQDLILVEPSGAAIQNTVDQERDVDHRALKIQYARYNAILRPTKDLGVTFTNVIG
jgi:hypothetical protein